MTLPLNDMHTYVQNTLEFLYDMVAGTVKDVGEDGQICKLTFEQRLKAATTLLKVVSDFLVQFDEKPKDKNALMLGNLEGMRKKIMARIKDLEGENHDKHE